MARSAVPAPRSTQRPDLLLAATEDIQLLINPATVSTIPEIVKAIAELVKLLRKNESTEEISRQLSNIGGLLAIINDKLNLVLNLLVALKVHIEEELDKQARFEALGQIDNIRTLYPVWAANPGDFKNEIERRSSALQFIAGNLMGRRTFANFHIVAYAMLHEHLLLTLHDKGPSIRPAVFERYAKYFEDGADPNVQGSVGQQVEYWKTTQSSYVSGQASLAAGGLYVFNRHEGSTCAGDDRCDVRVLNRVAGSAGSYHDGGEFRDYYNCRRDRFCSGLDPHSDKALGGDFAFVRSEALAAPAATSGTEVTWGWMNDRNNEYHMNEARIRHINDALTAIRLLPEEARKLRDWRLAS